MLKSPIYIRLKTINDLSRLVCSLERVPIPIFTYSFKNKAILASPMDSVSGRSIIYYVEISDICKHEFLSYKINKNVEEVTLVNDMRDTSANYSPIIKIASPPEQFIKPSRIGTALRYTGMGLQDLLSLSKLVAYRTIYEENTIPLFLFPLSSKNSTSEVKKEKMHFGTYLLGTALNMLDSTDVNYFYYVNLDKPITNYYLKFNMQKSIEPTFSNHPDEHGFVYLKIIQMAEPHPLVEA
ncbi:MAG: hypothetical protein AB7V56_05600 [Candidatus Nitrosocosmicus sp.]|uniref:hypothetical protein n=1 Tax=Candidatus Nitrosocosmicus agrestis TaxID=2563600 RepID=UPI00122E7973|nr:hypothetical protein [Candidatus Nitrosocosmicus sp. SS]KAA2280808.1 hypothetical protein F1Z66_10020 [Candidatus Nitrosocosmicus sp. SS]MDR4492132.1 hypothetical protein [Candidatus Nitrosocosmicus sp.]